MKHLTRALALSVVTALVASSASAAQEIRQNPGSINGNKQPDAASNVKKPNQIKPPKNCGTIQALSERVEACAKPLINVLQGTLEKWPRNDADIFDLCDQFAEAEKCIRDKARTCATGFRKVIVSTVANSFQRVRKRECVRSRTPALLKMVNCVEKHNSIPYLLVANATSRLSVIQDQMKDLDLKTSALCCLVSDIEHEIKRLMGPICGEETLLLVRMYRGVLEDATQLICRNLKCKNFLQGYSIPPLREANASGLLFYILKIVFSLG